MPLQLACADFTFPLLPHDQVLKLIAMLGFTGVDIGLFERRSHLWPSHELAAPEQSGAALQTRLAEQGLAAADIFLQLDPNFAPYAVNQPDAARRAHVRETFVRTLDYAAAAGAQHVTILPGILFAEEEADASWQRALEELVWRVAAAQQRALVLGVEPHYGSLAPDPVTVAALVAAVPGLTLTLDYTHFTRQGIPDAAVEPLLRLASHFHVRGARPGRLQSSFQDNTIDYARVLAAMQAGGYAGWLALEYVWSEWGGMNECDTLSETIRFRDELRRLLSS